MQERKGCLHPYGPLPWKDSAMERQEYMDAGSIKMEGSVKSGIFHTQEWRVI